MSNKKIINRVEKSNLVTFDLESFYPDEKDIYFFDLKNILIRDSIIIEKTFRNWIKTHNWDLYNQKLVYVDCSVEAIIPLWSKMLVCGKIKETAQQIVLGDKKKLISEFYTDLLNNKTNISTFKDKSVIIKGCGKKSIPEHISILAYIKIKKVAKSVMYGEACSSVPLYKASKPK